MNPCPSQPQQVCSAIENQIPIELHSTGMVSQVALDGAFVIRPADEADTQPNHRYFVTLLGGGVSHHVGIRYQIPDDQDDDVSTFS